MSIREDFLEVGGDIILGIVINLWGVFERT